MELGIARAWTVKQQLDFMNVPITVGAFEHPEEEKEVNSQSGYRIKHHKSYVGFLRKNTEKTCR